MGSCQRVIIYSVWGRRWGREGGRKGEVTEIYMGADSSRSEVDHFITPL